MELDRARATRCQSVAQREITAELVRRARSAGALAVALTGSTARARRTAISDLDYHVVGPVPDVRGISGEVDVVADSPERFERRLAEGDDFVHWTVCHGCVLHDPEGVMQGALELIERENLWPDPARKFERAAALCDIAERVLAIEDHEAAQEHARGALTSLARGLLLAERIFPLARVELPDQLRDAGWNELADWLRRSIHDQLTRGELTRALAVQRLALRNSDELLGTHTERNGTGAMLSAAGFEHRPPTPGPPPVLHAGRCR
jgi:hypothetical protein